MIKLLDHGFVALRDHMGNDLAVIRNARGCYDAEWRTGEDAGKDEKLLHYLMKHRHSTPFEAVTFTFEVKAPIFIFRQWHRHRTMSYNEVSARYTELPEEYYIPDLDQITTQSSSNKQMRTDEINSNAKFIQQMMESCNHHAFFRYKQMLELGCPRELARIVLPVATYSRMFCTVNLHNLLHFLRLRLGAGAQYEIKVYAEAIMELIEPIVPVTMAAFKKTL